MVFLPTVAVSFNALKSASLGNVRVQFESSSTFGVPTFAVSFAPSVHLALEGEAVASGPGEEGPLGGDQAVVRDLHVDVLAFEGRAAGAFGHADDVGAELRVGLVGEAGDEVAAVHAVAPLAVGGEVGAGRGLQGRGGLLLRRGLDGGEKDRQSGEQEGFLTEAQRHKEVPPALVPRFKGNHLRSHLHFTREMR